MWPEGVFLRQVGSGCLKFSYYRFLELSGKAEAEYRKVTWSVPSRKESKFVPLVIKVSCPSFGGIRRLYVISILDQESEVGFYLVNDVR